jgi:hypothetical protein
MGYSGQEMTWHGFRTIASTCLNELGWHPDLIELQLAHVESGDVRAAYNKAQRLVERRAMMQAWSDYLESLRSELPDVHRWPQPQDAVNQTLPSTQPDEHT